jgi:prevent-host-death family protein
MKSIGRTVTATQARSRLGHLTTWVCETGEPVLIRRRGMAQAVLVSVERYRRLAADQPEDGDWRTLVQQARDTIRAELGGKELPAAEDIIQAGRQARDDTLLRSG